MITEYERNQLARPCDYWLGKLSAAERNAILEEIFLIIGRWRLREKRKPTYQSPIAFGGLLGYAGGKPPEPDDIEVAFHLLGSSDPAFMALLAKRGLYKTFAMILAGNWKTAREWYIYRANEFLVGGLVFELEVAHDAGRNLWNDRQKEEAKKQRQLAEAREIGRVNKSQLMIERDAKLIGGARSFFERYPSWDVTDVAEKLKANGYDLIEKDKKKKGLTVSTIKRKIGGIQEEVREAQRLASLTPVAQSSHGGKSLP